MKIITVGRKMEVPEDLKQLFDKKLAKLDKFFKDDVVAYVTLSKKRNMECLELTISSGGTLFRCEEEDRTFNNALDSAIDVIVRRIRKNKTRLEKRLRDDAFTKTAETYEPLDEEKEFEIRTKTFAVKPMTPDEAILQMNLIGHEFYVFSNSESGGISVVYKRNNGGYGLIIPQDK